MGEDISLDDIASSIDKDTSKLASESNALDYISKKMELSPPSTASKPNNLHFEFKYIDIGSDFCITKLGSQQSKTLFSFIARLSTGSGSEGCCVEDIFPEITVSQPVLPKNCRDKLPGNQLPLNHALECSKLHRDAKKKLQSIVGPGNPVLDGESEIQTFAYLKISQKFRIYDILSKNKFYILWIDLNHQIWNDRECESNFCSSCYYGHSVV